MRPEYKAFPDSLIFVDAVPAFLIIALLQNSKTASEFKVNFGDFQATWHKSKKRRAVGGGR